MTLRVCSMLVQRPCLHAATLRTKSLSGVEAWSAVRVSGTLLRVDDLIADCARQRLPEAPSMRKAVELYKSLCYPSKLSLPRLITSLRKGCVLCVA